MQVLKSLLPQRSNHNSEKELEARRGNDLCHYVYTLQKKKEDSIGG